MTHIHAANVIAHLERGGLTLDQLIRFYGTELLTDKAGNGDTYYDNAQVNAFYAQACNVPV